MVHFNRVQTRRIVHPVFLSCVDLEAFQRVPIARLNSKAGNRGLCPELDHDVSLLVLTLVSKGQVKERRNSELIGCSDP